MNKFAKAGIAVGLMSTLMLGACGAGDEKVFEGGKDGYTESQLLTDLKASAGDGVVKQVIGSKILLDTYKVDAKLVQERKDQLEKEYAASGGLKEQLKSMNMTEKTFENQLKIEIAHNMALKEMNKVTPEKIKKRFEEIKMGTDTFTISSSNEKTIKAVEKAMRAGKSLDEVKAIAEKDKEAVVERKVLLKGQATDFEQQAFKMKKGEVKLIPTITGTHVMLVMGKKEAKFEDAKAGIEQELLYSKVSSFDDVLKFLVKNKDIELKGVYSDLLKKSKDSK